MTLPWGSKVVRSTSLTPMEEAVVVAFRGFTQLPLYDCLYSLREATHHLIRSFLHRRLQRHGFSRLPKGKLALDKEETQSVSHRLFLRGYRQSMNREKPLIPFYRHRQDVEVCLCAIACRGDTGLAIKAFLECLKPPCPIKYTPFLQIKKSLPIISYAPYGPARKAYHQSQFTRGLNTHEGGAEQPHTCQAGANFSKYGARTPGRCQSEDCPVRQGQE